MRLRGLLTAMAVMVVFTGCGSESKPPTLESVAADVACENMKQKEPDVFARESADCVVGSDTVEIHTFSSNDARDRYLDAGSAVGNGKLDHGDRWVSIARYDEEIAMAQRRRPNSQDIVVALSSSDSVLGRKVPVAAAECMADVFVGSAISDASLWALVDGDRDYKNEADTAVLESLTVELGECAAS